MADLVVVFLTAGVASLVLTPVVRAVSRQWGVMDVPDGGRKLHCRPVPVWGGVAVYLAMVLAMLAAGLGSFGVGEELTELSAVVIAAGGLVCFFGCVDDHCRLPARLKLLLQIASVLPVVMVGYSVQSITLFGCWIDLGWLGVPLTVLWLVGCINAINLLDGMDGLASMVGLFTAATMAAIATHQGNHYVVVVAVALVGALAGFLVYNRPPASIFLGDSGSMVIGLVVGILGVRSTLKTSAALSITAPLVVMTFPIFDTFLAVVRRKLTGRRFDAADREHIHHRLLDRGLSPWLVLAVIGVLCLATGIAATVASIVRSDALAWTTAAVLIVLVIRLRLFGNYELSLARKFLARGLVALTRRLGVRRSADRVPRSADLAGLSAPEVWAGLVDCVRPWRVRYLRVILYQRAEPTEEHTWAASNGGSGTDPAWTIAVRLDRGKERVCELRAAGLDASGADSLEPAGLIRVLRSYAEHFADHPERVAELAQADRRRSGSGPEWKGGRVAA